MADDSTTNNENDAQGQFDESTHDFDNGTGSTDSPNGDDLYAPYLEKFPTSLHGVARDVFKEWDAGVTKRIQSVHQEYAPYKPFIEQYEPDAIQQAIQLTSSLEADPEAFYKALQGAYGFEAQQAAQEIVEEQVGEAAPEQEPASGFNDEQAQLLQTLAEYVINERQQAEQVQEQAENDRLLDEAMAGLKTTYGEFDEAYVLQQIGQGVEPEAAVQQFQDLVHTWATAQNNPLTLAPIVMSSGGGIPATNLRPADLSSGETQDLVQEILRQAKENG